MSSPPVSCLRRCTDYPSPSGLQTSYSHPSTPSLPSRSSVYESLRPLCRTSRTSPSQFLLPSQSLDSDSSSIPTKSSPSSLDPILSALMSIQLLQLLQNPCTP